MANAPPTPSTSASPAIGPTRPRKRRLVSDGEAAAAAGRVRINMACSCVSAWQAQLSAERKPHRKTEFFFFRNLREFASRVVQHVSEAAQRAYHGSIGFELLAQA